MGDKNSDSDDFAKELEELLERKSNTVRKNLLQDFEDVDTPLEISDLKPGMFNATVDSGFGQKETKVDLKKILLTLPLPRSPIGEYLFLDTIEMKGWYGRLSSGFSHTREFGKQGNINIQFSSVQFKMILSNESGCTANIAFNIYKNGKMRCSGGLIGTTFGNHIELIRKFVVEKYTNGEEFLYNPFKYNNLSGQFMVNGIFSNLWSIAQRSKRYNAKRVSYEPEINPLLYIYFEDANLILTKTGKVQIIGAKSPSELLQAYKTGNSFIRDLNLDDQITITGIFLKSKLRKISSREPSHSGNRSRMRKVELITFARQLGIVDFRVNGKIARKDQIWEKIFEKVKRG